MNAEDERIAADSNGEWLLWGPYLSERQWGTVREDYSADGDAWRFFPHDHARRRVYRWGEDGLLGICDRECRLCCALALWNGQDPILKERLFGLANPEGNHGEDVKELYYYLDATPTASYLKGLYKYPIAAYPYEELVAANAARSRSEPEFEILDSAVWEQGYFDVYIEYAKSDWDDILIRYTIINHSPQAATLHVLPTIWFRNTWSWGGGYEHSWGRPRLWLEGGGITAEHATLGRYRLEADGTPQWLFTENESNLQQLFEVANPTPYVKDAFHERVINGRTDAVNPQQQGTKAAAWYILQLPPGDTATLRCRLRDARHARAPFDEAFDQTLEQRRSEADAFYAARCSDHQPEHQAIYRQAMAGLIWNQVFYYYHVRDWVNGDPAQPAPPAHRSHPNQDWTHLFARDVLSVPDKWEFPWFAVWDTAFHMVPFGELHPAAAKHQLLRFLRDWYQHPNGELPAYEFNFSDANPPVHAWACRYVYEQDGGSDVAFLKQAFHKLALNFTWWVNRKDLRGKHLFGGGFLGLDNIGVFDRSQSLPSGEYLEQADGTAWMAFFCAEMLRIALELSRHDDVYEDMASKFLEHYVSICSAINTLDGSGLWDTDEGFYYDKLHLSDGSSIALKVRSIVGLIPLFSSTILTQETLEALPVFRRRLDWFVRHRYDVLGHLEFPTEGEHRQRPMYLLSLPSRAQLEQILRYLFDENEFFSPYGIRSLSKVYAHQPYVLEINGSQHTVAYLPGESDSGMFGGNSNWRGPIWFPINYLLIEALERYGEYYGDQLHVEVPTGSGQWVDLHQAARMIARRLIRLFEPDASGRRPCHGDYHPYATIPTWKDLLLFYEYYDGDTGRGCGASHQTGWTALVASLIRRYARDG